MSTEINTPGSTEPTRTEIPARSRISNVTIINVVLFVGLIVLYVLNVFPLRGTGSVSGIEDEMTELSERIAEGAFNIAYVNSDSLMARYKLASAMREEMQQEQRRLETDLQRRQRSFQTEVETFQRQLQFGSISMENAQVKEQELMQQQQELMQLNDTYTNRLMRKELEMTTDLYEKITEFLKRKNETWGFDYILGYSPGGGILYANSQHDITDMVVEKLNQEYDAQR
ncbi:MAG: OmpH family outer membrane protein [Bacteroidales bacterium]